jgi:uncharacterized protein (DUF488 family)
MQQTVFTVGHSNHEESYLVELLKLHNINAVCDVRSVPYSRQHSQFNRESLEPILRSQGIAYLFLGKELGARSSNPKCYENGKVRYDRIAVTELFKQGIERVCRGLSDGYRIALMCAEKEPLECHRSILVARRLVEQGVDVQHIRGDGSLESHVHAVSRLVGEFDWVQGNMFLPQDQLIRDAYERQGERIAYTQNEELISAGERA